jgi:peptidoglycan/xylan/chitin deacetylase (PgdA/CDA1 family)
LVAVALVAAAILVAATEGGARKAQGAFVPSSHRRAGVGTGNRGSAGARNRAARRRRKARQARRILRQERIWARQVRLVLRRTSLVSAGSSGRRAIALTFDDGPSPYTPALVRVLVRMRVPATFFVVGQQLNDFSATLRNELAHGFVIGDHTENHALLSRLRRREQYGQIEAAALRLRALGARLPSLFRPPYGGWDRQTMSILRRLRMLMVLWSIDPGDWRRPGVAAIVAGVLANARPGAIVILHDGGGDRSQTVAALPWIIRGLRRARYDLVTVPELLALDPPRWRARAGRHGVRHRRPQARLHAKQHRLGGCRGAHAVGYSPHRKHSRCRR